MATDQREVSRQDQVFLRSRRSRKQAVCTLCRSRKVKCDRVQPCSTCSEQGYPNDCVFLDMNRKRDRGIHRPLQPFIPQSLPQTPMKEIYLERFLEMDNKLSLPSRRNRTWLSRAAEGRFSSPVLCDAFEATATMYFGVSTGDASIVRAAQIAQLKLLRGLQQAVSSASECKSPGTLFAIVLATKFELLQTSEKALLNHVIGAAKVVEHRGPNRHLYGAEHQLFIDNRLSWIMAAIVCRSPTFLASREWKTVPWSINPSSKDFQQLLVDHFADIPTLLAQFDALAGAGANPIAEPQIQDQRAAFCNLTAGLKRDLRQWKREQANPRGRPSADLRFLPASSRIFPIFQCQDTPSGLCITPPRITYPDPDLAIALCMYYSSLLVVSHFDIRREGKMQQLQEQYILACIICRSMEYFARSIHGEAMVLILFGLRLAYDTFPDGSFEKKWVKGVFSSIEKTTNLRICATLMEDFSVMKNGRLSTFELPVIPEQLDSLGRHGDLAGLSEPVMCRVDWESL